MMRISLVLLGGAAGLTQSSKAQSMMQQMMQGFGENIDEHLDALAEAMKDKEVAKQVEERLPEAMKHLSELAMSQLAIVGQQEGPEIYEVQDNDEVNKEGTEVKQPEVKEEDMKKKAFDILKKELPEKLQKPLEDLVNDLTNVKMDDLLKGMNDDLKGKNLMDVLKEQLAEVQAKAEAALTPEEKAKVEASRKEMEETNTKMQIALEECKTQSECKDEDIFCPMKCTMDKIMKDLPEDKKAEVEAMQKNVASVVEELQKSFDTLSEDIQKATTTEGKASSQISGEDKIETQQQQALKQSQGQKKSLNKNILQQQPSERTS